MSVEYQYTLMYLLAFYDKYWICSLYVSTMYHPLLHDGNYDFLHANTHRVVIRML